MVQADSLHWDGKVAHSSFLQLRSGEILDRKFRHLLPSGHFEKGFGFSN